MPNRENKYSEPPQREQTFHVKHSFCDRFLHILESALSERKVQTATLNRIERKVDKIMAEVDDAKLVLDGINREVGQIVPFIQKLIDAQAAGAGDKALADLVRAEIPALTASVAALDAFTPEPPPEGGVGVSSRRQR